MQNYIIMLGFVTILFQTGTLTRDELDIWGIVPVKNGEIQEPLFKAKSLPENSLLLRGMASCHSLSVIDGNIGGDPLDIKVRTQGNEYFGSTYYRLFFRCFKQLNG